MAEDVNRYEVNGVVNVDQTWNGGVLQGSGTGSLVLEPKPADSGKTHVYRAIDNRRFVIEEDGTKTYTPTEVIGELNAPNFIYGATATAQATIENDEVVSIKRALQKITGGNFNDHIDAESLGGKPTSVNGKSAEDKYIYNGDKGFYRGDDHVIKGLAGSDWIKTSNGIDIIEGGEGADEILAGDGNDIIHGNSMETEDDDNAPDILRGEDGDDFIIVQSGDTAYGGAGNDVMVSGGLSEKHFFTESGDDKIYGGVALSKEVVTMGSGTTLFEGGGMSEDPEVSNDDGDTLIVPKVPLEYDSGKVVISRFIGEIPVHGTTVTDPNEDPNAQAYYRVTNIGVKDGQETVLGESFVTSVEQIVAKYGSSNQSNSYSPLDVESAEDKTITIDTPNR